MSQAMKILDAQNVRGRGTVVIVQDIPMGVKIGCLVHQGDKSWKIVSVAWFSPSQTADKVGLCLQPIDHTDIPEVGELFL